MAKKGKPKKLTKKQKATVKKHYKTFIVFGLVLIIVLGALAYVFRDEIKKYFAEPPEQTRKVSNITIDQEGKLSWDKYETSAKYFIKIANHEEIEITNSEFDISEYKDEIGDSLTVVIFAQEENKDRSQGQSIRIYFDEQEQSFSFEFDYSYEGYYAGINYGMSDQEIFNKLYEIISVVTAGNGSQNSSYGEAREILVDSDYVPETKKLWGIYDNADIEADWGSGNVFQREHVWPNSKLGIDRVNNSSRNIGSDPHNLRAIMGSINSSRSNGYFVDGSGKNGYTVGTEGFYPGDEHIGDVARILLYMAVRYKDVLSIVETPSGPSYEPAGAQMGTLSLLLDWHESDPVDAFEIRRNDVIYQHQGNRNPFIDHPELFERVYNEIVSQSLQTSNSITSLQIVIDNLEIQKQAFVFTRKSFNSFTN